MKPLSAFILDLVERVNFLKDWMNNGVPAVSRHPCLIINAVTALKLKPVISTISHNNFDTCVSHTLTNSLHSWNGSETNCNTCVTFVVYKIYSILFFLFYHLYMLQLLLGFFFVCGEYMLAYAWHIHVYNPLLCVMAYRSAYMPHRNSSNIIVECKHPNLAM